MRYTKMSDFNSFWKLQNDMMKMEDFVDERLTVAELKKVREYIVTLNKKGLPAEKIILALQKINKKLVEKWRAERVYWTETKRDDTKLVAEASEELGVKSYRVILSPNACDHCRALTKNGMKKFNNDDLKKGEGTIPPFHPNCYCILLPE